MLQFLYLKSFYSKPQLLISLKFSTIIFELYPKFQRQVLHRLRQQRRFRK